MSFYSEWFPPEIKPVRVGEYQCKLSNGNDVHMRLWNGEHWC